MAGANTTQRTITFTDREREVLDLIVRGHTNGQIAGTLGISFATAKWHVSELITKLGVASREEVADYWRHERAPRRRLTRALRGLFAAPALKLASGGAAVGVAATGVVWVAIAANGGGSPIAASVTVTPTLQVAVITPVPTVQQNPPSSRPAICPTSGPAPDGPLCHALNWPHIAALDKGDCDLSGADLAGSTNRGDIDFPTNLSHIDFRGCNLSDARLSGGMLNGATLEGVSASRADLSFSTIADANFAGANLTGADLARTVLQVSDFTNAILLGADLTNAITRGARWSNTICPDGTNSDANGGTCVGTISVSDYWPGPGGLAPLACSIDGGPLGVGVFCPADLYAGLEVDASGTCSAPASVVATTDFRRADLRSCQFAGAALAGADFERASLAGANLEGADLSGASLFLADLTGANLRGANLDGAVISHSNLEGADLTGASTTGAMLRGTYKNTTCPDGTNSDTDDGDALTCANNLVPQAR
ncbi:MAG: pentapeptide repeat-containing protein [Tepidiformaceae bacterium]